MGSFGDVLVLGREGPGVRREAEWEEAAEGGTARCPLAILGVEVPVASASLRVHMAGGGNR